MTQATCRQPELRKPANCVGCSDSKHFWWGLAATHVPKVAHRLQYAQNSTFFLDCKFNSSEKSRLSTRVTRALKPQRSIHLGFFLARNSIFNLSSQSSCFGEFG